MRAWKGVPDAQEKVGPTETHSCLSSISFMQMFQSKIYSSVFLSITSITKLSDILLTWLQQTTTSLHVLQDSYLYFAQKLFYVEKLWFYNSISKPLKLSAWEQSAIECTCHSSKTFQNAWMHSEILGLVLDLPILLKKVPAVAYLKGYRQAKRAAHMILHTEL